MVGLGGEPVIIANPQHMFVDAVVPAVQSTGLRVVQAATTRAGLVDAVRMHPEALCLTAWTFADGGVSDVMPEIRTVAPRAVVVVLSNDSDPNTLSAALAIGMRGFIHTSRGLSVLLDALRRLQNGDIVIEASLTPDRTERTSETKRVRKLATYLTPREYECLAMVVSGLDTAAMSRRLGVSRTTIRSHVQSMLMKLNVHSRLEAAALAVQHQLLPEAEHMPRIASGL
jgi:two-component system, NarL family, nitrate/nitrite response regulator NarL